MDLRRSRAVDCRAGNGVAPGLEEDSGPAAGHPAAVRRSCPPRSADLRVGADLLPLGAEVGRASGPRARGQFYNLGGVVLGDRVVVSQDVYFCGGTHDYTDPAYPLVRLPIIVEDDVWIGAGAFIGPGVTVGQGAVVGARAVVVQDVPPWKVVAGNPARVIKDRVLRAS